MENWNAEIDSSVDIDPQNPYDELISEKSDISSQHEHSGHRRSSTLEWKVPIEYYGKTKLSLTLDETEREIFAEEVRDTQHTLLDKDCCAQHVLSVWNHVSKFIIKKLKEGFGVQIPGLCTITYKVEKLDIPDTLEYFELVKTPIMIISPQIIKMYKLEIEDTGHIGLVKAVPINLTEVANSSKLPRSTVEGVVTELLQAFVRAVVCNKNIEFPFPYIGKLQVQNRKATMKFYEDFYTRTGFDLQQKYLNWVRSVSRTQNEEDDEGIDNEQILPGQMTPLRRHIPTEFFRSVFHLGEVRSVHDGELLADPFDHENKKHRKISLHQKSNHSAQHYNLNDPNSNGKQHRDRIQSNISRIKSSDHSLNNSDDIKYHWNVNRKYWQDSYGQPITYRAEPLYKVEKTGKYMIDAVNASKPLFMDALFTHHHNVCCKVLGLNNVLKHYARRNKLVCKALSYDDMNYDLPSPK